MKRISLGAAVAAAVVGLGSAVVPAGAADVDLTAGVLWFNASMSSDGSVPNALTIPPAGDTYTIDDPAEARFLARKLKELEERLARRRETVK